MPNLISFILASLYSSNIAEVKSPIPQTPLLQRNSDSWKVDLCVPSFESWLYCNYGGRDDTASTQLKATELCQFLWDACSWAPSVTSGETQHLYRGQRKGTRTPWARWQTSKFDTWHQLLCHRQEGNQRKPALASPAGHLVMPLRIEKNCLQQALPKLQNHMLNKLLLFSKIWDHHSNTGTDKQGSRFCKT